MSTLRTRNRTLSRPQVDPSEFASGQHIDEPAWRAIRTGGPASPVQQPPPPSIASPTPAQPPVLFISPPVQSPKPETPRHHTPLPSPATAGGRQGVEISAGTGTSAAREISAQDERLRAENEDLRDRLERSNNALDSILVCPYSRREMVAL